MSELVTDLSVSTSTGDELRQELIEALDMTAVNLHRAAVIVRELESRGEDLSSLRIGMIGYLRAIANGRLLTEAVVRFAERPALLRHVSSLPLDQQQKLADGELIKVAESENGVLTHRLIDPLDMSVADMRIVFDRRSGIRSPESQQPLLERRVPRRHRHVSRATRVRSDRERGGIVVGRTFVTAAEVLLALADMRPTPLRDEEDGRQTESILLSLTSGEKQFIQQLAAQSACRPAELVRRACEAHGIIWRARGL